MTVQCPTCSTDYLLPGHLLGSRGARVRCPSCDESFTVLRVPGSDALRVEGRRAQPVPEHAEREAPEPPPPLPMPELRSPTLPPDDVDEGEDDVLGPPVGDAATLALQFLDALSDKLGDRLPDAMAQGRVLSELGPDLMRSYDDFRRTLVKGADAAVFRAAVKERWGIDLEPATGPSGF